MEKVKALVKNNGKIIGIIFVILSTLCFTIGHAFIKLSSSEIDPIHLMFLRSISGLSLILIFTSIQGKIRRSFQSINRKKGFWLVMRGLSGAFAMFFYITALSLTDLGEVGSLSNVNPIFTVFFAYFILKEGFNYKIWFAIAIALAGVFLIRNPFTQDFSIAHILILFAASLMSLGAVINRKLKLIRVDSWIIVISFLFFGILFFMPKFIIDRPSYSFESYAYIIIAGCLMTIGHYFLTSAAKYIESKNISIISLLSVFEFMFLGYFMFGENLDEFKLLGGGLIIVSAVMTIYAGISRKSIGQLNKDSKMGAKYE
jgi:drug/metabolite transporter (DMT)-like permease